MKRSTSAAYMNYGRAKANGEHGMALQFLVSYIDENAANFDIAEQADAMQLLGDAYFDVGRPGLAGLLQSSGVAVGGSCFTSLLAHARFFARKVKDVPRAVEICDKVIEKAKISQDGRNELYINIAYELKKEFRES